ncbi:MAG: LysR family transcriptional regulator [Hungatella sp.]|nr:LysR family transcriptional regulator [Hungatella sp.]
MSVVYDYYRIFYYVAKYQSFTKAAGVLMSNQPNVTRAMNSLEQELGCRLFLRSNRGVTLTPEGEKLYAHIRIAQEQIAAGERELASGLTLQSGSVSIGASEIGLHCLLLPILRNFHAAYPGVHIRITNQPTQKAAKAVKDGLVDMAVVAAPAHFPKPLQEIPLSGFQDMLFAGPRFASLAGQPVSLNRLADYPFICLGRDSQTYEFFSQFFASHGLILSPDMEAATTAQVLAMIRYDLGIGFLPPAFAADALGKGEIFALNLEEPVPHRTISLVKDSGRPLSVAAQTLECMIRENTAPPQSKP